MYDAGVALSGMACFITPDLARDLANDIMTLVSYPSQLHPAHRTYLYGCRGNICTCLM